MYCVTVTYPKSEDTKFNHEYYVEKHIPLCAEAFAEYGFLGTVLRSGQGGAPGATDVNYASIDLLFASQAQMQQALAAAGRVVSADLANYTDAKPKMTFSAVQVSLERSD